MSAPPDTSWAHRPAAVVAREIILMGLLRALVHVHTRPRVHGRELLAGLAPPVLFAANHASHLDTPVILQALPARWRRKTTVVAAMDYFFQRRLLGAAVSLAFIALPIERGGVSPETRERIDGLVARRWSLLMYPEGTRSRTGRLGTLKTGVARLALQHDLPIVPIYLTGTFESHPKGSKWPKPYPVTVRFGKPLSPVAADHRVLTAQLREALAALAADAGRSAP